MSKYLHLDRPELPEAVMPYYDPILDVHHEVPVMFGMVRGSETGERVSAAAIGAALEVHTTAAARRHLIRRVTL